MPNRLVRAIADVRKSKSTKRKEEYNRLVAKHGVRKIGSYSQWRSRSSAGGTSTRKTKPAESARTKTIKKSAKELYGFDWDRDKPTARMIKKKRTKGK